jgi:hypothetical protein
MKAKLFAVVIAAAVLGLVGAGQSYAHHSYAATYFTDQSQTINGVLAEFLFRNPHSFIKVQAPDKDGTMVIWSVEWGGGAQLARQGVNEHTLHAGDKVVVKGNPGRDPEEHRMRVQSVVLGNGDFKWEGTVE